MTKILLFLTTTLVLFLSVWGLLFGKSMGLGNGWRARAVFALGTILGLAAWTWLCWEGYV